MGMDQSVQFSSGNIPDWNSVQSFFQEQGFPIELRMIEGELAFPDESPPEDWKEIRVGTEAGMISIRRDGSTLSFVIWGNSDLAMIAAWNRLTWGYAKLGEGTITTSEGSFNADEFEAKL